MFPIGPRSLLLLNQSTHSRVAYSTGSMPLPRVGFGAHCGVLLCEADHEYLCWCLGEMGDLTDEARALMEEESREP